MYEYPAIELSTIIQGDDEMAWAWHCNIAVPIMDTLGVSHQRANEAAAALMQHLFSADTSKHPRFLSFAKIWEQQSDDQ